MASGFPFPHWTVVSGWGEALQLSLVSPPRAGPIQSVHQEVFDPVSGARSSSEVPAACGQSRGLNNGPLCLLHSSLNRPRPRLLRLRPPMGSGEGGFTAGRRLLAFLWIAAEAKCLRDKGRDLCFGKGVSWEVCVLLRVSLGPCAKSSRTARTFLARCIFENCARACDGKLGPCVCGLYPAIFTILLNILSISHLPRCHSDDSMRLRPVYPNCFQSLPCLCGCKCPPT